MFTDDLVDTSIPPDVGDVSRASARVSSEGIKLDGMIYHSSVQLVKEIMGRSPGKRDRSGDQAQGRRSAGGRRSEEQIDLAEEVESDALERARRRIAAWPTRAVRAGVSTSSTLHSGIDESSRVSERTGQHLAQSAQRYEEDQPYVIGDATTFKLRSPSRHVQDKHDNARESDAETDEEDSPPHRINHDTAINQHTPPDHTPTGTKTNANQTSSSSSSSFQRRFREIQSESPGRVVWGRNASRETADGGVGEMMNGSAKAERNGSARVERTRSEGDSISSNRQESGTTSTHQRETSNSQRTHRSLDDTRRVLPEPAITVDSTHTHLATPSPGTTPFPRDMSFAQIDHSTPVRRPTNVRGILGSSEDEETVDSTVSSSPVARAVVAGEGLSRSILRRDGESREDGVAGPGEFQDVSVRNTSLQQSTRGHTVSFQAPAPRQAEDSTDVLRETTTTSPQSRGSVPAPTPARPPSTSPSIARERSRTTPNQRSERNIGETSSREDAVRERMSLSATTTPDQSVAPRERTPPRSGADLCDSELGLGTPAATITAPISQRSSPRRDSELGPGTPAATAITPILQRRSPRRSTSTSRRAVEGERISNKQSPRQGVEREPSFGDSRNDAENPSFGVSLPRADHREPSFGISSVGSIPEELSSPTRNDGTEKTGDRSAHNAHGQGTASATPTPHFNDADPSLPRATTPLLESAVGRHVLAWFETHHLLERDRAVAARDEAAAEQELREALRVDPASQRKRDEARWAWWAMMTIVVLLLITRIFTPEPSSSADEFYYTRLQTHLLARERWSRLPLGVRMAAYLLRWIVGDRQLMAGLAWVGVVVPSAVVVRGRGFRVPV